MGKKKSDPAMDMLNLDMQQRDRELAAQVAMHNAEIALAQKKLEMVDMPGLEEQKNEFALNYALEQAKLDYTKEMGSKEFGESQRQFDLTNQLNQQRLILDQNAQAFQEKIQTGQLELNTANVTGFFQGQPTLARMTMEADETGYLNGAKTMAREKQEFDQGMQNKQFELSKAQTVLNAPRGPADYSAYLNRLYGLQSTGMVPGVVGQLLSGAPVSQAGANQGPMPMSNTQFATAAVYGSQPPNNVADARGSQVAQDQGVNPRAALQAQLTREQAAKAAPDSPTGEAQWDLLQQPSPTNHVADGNIPRTGVGPTGSETPSTNPLQDRLNSWINSPESNTTFQMAAGGNPTVASAPSLFANGAKSGSDINFRDWQKLSPVTQDYTKGFAEENLGQPAQDFVWGIAQGAPAMQSGAQSRRGLF